MESHHSSRPSRLEKQEEFEIEEEGFMLSPVTIQIEDRGSNQGGEEQEDKDTEQLYVLSEDDDGLGASGKSSCDLSPDTMDRLQEIRPERRKASSRVKLLVRSHAVHDDASPPPDLETIITNTNMLSVTNASSFSTQTQSKGASNKIRLGNQSSSQGSTESSSASGLSRDSSTETYTDSSGVDLQQFIVDTLHKNQKDRLMLLKVEQELILLIKDSKRQSLKFPQMSSYNRMLVHRVAAFFGLDHYVDGNGTAVIVNKTKTTRMPQNLIKRGVDWFTAKYSEGTFFPDSRFQDFIRDELLPEEPKKSILKRDSISFEEGKEKSPERQSSTDSRRSKSFEEREEEYEKARARIFNQDEGLGESPLNRSQEGTYSSSRRSSQEDVRWPSSETRPWSSTDSDSSGRPLGVKLGSSFETDASGQSGKGTRSSAVLAKAESDSKSFLAPTKANRPAMTKASSFGGISVLSRESSGRSVTPRITKAESFNVTTISSSLASSFGDRLLDTPEDSDKTSIPATSISSSVSQPVPPCQFSPASSAEQTFPVVAGQPIDIKIPCIQDSTQTSNWQSGSQDSSKDFSTHTVAIGQPLMWPYSTGTDVLFSGGVFVNPQSGNQRVVFPPYQPVSVSSAEQASTTVVQVVSGTSLSPSSQSSQRQQPHSTLQSSVQQSQPTVNTSSSSAVFYVPYLSQLQYTAAHQSSLTPVQNIRHPSPSSQFLAEPRPIVLFPVCYVHQSSNVQSVRHVFPSSNAAQNVQSSGIQGQNIADLKTPGSASSSFVLNPQYLPCFPASTFTQSAETTTTTALYAYGSIIVGNSGNTCTTSVKQQFTSQSSQPPVCVQQSAVQLQTTPVTLPPVYVSITSSTQSPATRTHAGGHVAAQFSSFRSHSLPVSSSSSSGALTHQFNTGTPFLGYTVYTPPIQSNTIIPTPSSLTAVTVNQNTHASALPSQFAPAYVSTFQVLQPNVPLIANIGNSSPSQSAIRSQFTNPISTVSNVPMSFPLVKQASDPGIGEHITLSSADFCLVGPPLQHHLGPLLLPQQPSIARFPRASISHHSPANRPPKTRKHRSKGNTTATAAQSSQSIFEIGGNHILEVEGLPEDMKKHDIERYLEAVTELGAKIHFLNPETLEVVDESNDFLATSKHTVLAVFESDTAAQNALLSIKTTKFQLRRWLRSQDSSKTKT